MSIVQIPIATALRECLKEGYKLPTLLSDFIAGLVVSMVALPLSLALAIAVGLPPHHGIITAVVAGIVTALLGGSRTQVSGPTAAFVVILAPIVAEHGHGGLLFSTLIAGILLILMGICRFGQFISFVPYPVTTGFTAGIAVVLGILSLNDFLGLDAKLPPGHFIDKLETLIIAFPNFKWQEALVGIVTLFAMLFWPKISKKIPATLIAIGIGTAFSIWLGNMGFHVTTIGDRFDMPTGAKLIESVFSASNVHFPASGEMRELLTAGLVIAALAAIESLLSATVADSMSGTRHNPNAELVGIGIGNVLSAFSGGISATGAIARTATAIKSGAKTPLASVFHALIVLFCIVVFSAAIKYLPMTTLAALLINTAIHMSHIHQFAGILKHADRSDSITLIACFGLTVFVDMVAGVTAGIILASFLFMKQVIEITHVQLSGNEDGESFRHMPHVKIPEGVMIYRISGPLFFGTAEKALDRAAFVKSHLKVMIIDILDVPVIDMTGIVALESIIAKLEKSKIRVIICSSVGIYEKLNRKLKEHEKLEIAVAENVDDAIMQSYKLL